MNPIFFFANDEKLCFHFKVLHVWFQASFFSQPQKAFHVIWHTNKSQSLIKEILNSIDAGFNLKH